MSAKGLCVLALTALACWATPAAGAPQVQVSPGPLARAHAALEGVTNCVQCHDPTRALSASRCLACHKRVAERIARRVGVHRDLRDDCTRCHREHRGVDAEIRQIDRAAFNHTVETGFPLDGQHARIATTCGECHKKRSFLDARPACSACHKDVHNGALGKDCTICHSTAIAFKRTRERFDHARARFVLTGAHRPVACEKCHAAGVFRGLHYEECSGCHHSPHRRPLGPTCTSCHTTERWALRSFEHDKTGFVLVGAHRPLACARCHVGGIKAPLRFDRCSSCHANLHRDSVKDDCRVCHTEDTFGKASFDHRARTGFPLAGRHAALTCRQCHTTISAPDVPVAQKVIDFSGASAACATCHKDQHKGEYGRVCDACHGPTTFKAAGFVHPRAPEFFAGRHQGLTCVKCHVRSTAPAPEVRTVKAVAARPPSLACSECHADVHLGQVGPACDRCHAVDAARFAPARFSHDSTSFALTGKHRAAACVKCHPPETAVFPGGSGTAKRLQPVPADCARCHKDPHLGQVEPRCGACHTTDTFTVTSYAHPGLEYMFGLGNHNRLACAKCHKKETGQFPAGVGTAIRFKVARTCIGCHP